jgi:hypothetical protein
MTQSAPEQRQIAQVLCLVYHEARNIRTAVRRRQLPDATRYAAFMGLSPNPELAWRDLAGFRRSAVQAASAAAAASVFAKRFGLTLAELAELFRQPFWHDPALRGPQWAAIAVKLWELVATEAMADRSISAEIYRELLDLPLGSGRLADQLALLPP